MLQTERVVMTDRSNKASAIFLFLCVLLAYVGARPDPFDPRPMSRESDADKIGASISGDRVVAIIHGDSAPPKVDLQMDKDSERDPIRKYDHVKNQN